MGIRLLPAFAASLALVLTAPFIGQLRDLLKRAFPDRFVLIIGAGITLLLAASWLMGVARIRDRRRARLAALACSVGLLAFYVARFRTGNAEVDAVQLFHFLEYGLVTSLFYLAVRPAADPSIVVASLLYGLLTGILEEWMQWFVPLRVGEVGDVFLNAYAVICALFFSFALWPPARFAWRLQATSRAPLLRFAAAVGIVFAGFFHVAHLGYEIADEEIGRFRSYFPADALARHQADRARSWRENPPTSLPVLAKEDYYLTEAAWHVQRRNTAYTARDFPEAWLENRILERYYDPFLDLHSFQSGERHRWAPAQRAEVAAGREPALDARYVSDVGAQRIYLRPTKTELWGATVLLAGALLALARPRAGSAPAPPDV